MTVTLGRPAVREAAASPCVNCPWLTSNHRRPHPDGWYKPENIRRLWKGMRAGERMSCHPTDPRNPVSAEAEAAGYRPAPESSQVRECAGALVLVQREWIWFQDHFPTIAAYRKARPHGLTRQGLIALASRAMPWPGDVPMSRPGLSAEVSVPGMNLPWPPPPLQRCAVCSEPILTPPGGRPGLDYVHQHTGEAGCGTGDGATATPPAEPAP